MRLRARVALLAILLFLPATTHAAGGIAMKWTQCYGDGGATNKAFACNTNSGRETLVLSFVPPSAMNDVNGNGFTVDWQAAAGALPPWWQYFNVGTCRASSVSVNATFPTDAVACLDEFAGQSSVGIGSYFTGFSDGRVRLQVAEAVPFTSLVTLAGGQEYFALNIVFNHAKTIGPGSCPGCFNPVCLMFSSLKITSSGPDVVLTEPLPGNGFLASWQNGNVGLGIPEDGTGWRLRCTLPNPARNQTWGAIKSLYR